MAMKGNLALRSMLRKEEEPHTGTSRGKHILFYGEPFFELSIFSKLIPPFGAWSSLEAFHLWGEKVGRPPLCFEGSRVRCRFWTLR